MCAVTAIIPSTRYTSALENPDSRATGMKGVRIPFDPRGLVPRNAEATSRTRTSTPAIQAISHPQSRLRSPTTGTVAAQLSTPEPVIYPIALAPFVSDPLNYGPKYKYTSDLLDLDTHISHSKNYLPVECHKITTPLQPHQWAKALSTHPDRSYSSYIVQGITRGFHIGFQHNACTCRPAKVYMLSALAHPQPVASYLDTELQAGRVIGPLAPDTAKLVQVSRFGVIPKANQPGKWRLILDLSHPEEPASIQA